MKVEKIKEEIAKKEEQLKAMIVKQADNAAFAEMVGQTNSQICRFISGADRWSFKKILEISEKVGL